MIRKLLIFTYSLNTDHKLYQVKFYGIEVEVVQSKYTNYDSLQAKLDKSKEFLSGLYVTNKSLIASTKAAQKKVWYKYLHDYYKAYIFYYNKKMDAAVKKYKEKLKQEKAKKVKANY